MKTDRLLQVIRWNVIGRKGELLRTFIGGVIGMFFAMSVANGFWFPEEAADYGEVSSMAVVMLICIGVVMLKYATGVSFNTKTKTAFLNYAMLPATNMEKYVANWIYVTLVLGGTFIAGLIVGDGVQRIVSEIVYGTNTSVTHTAINLLADFRDPKVLGMIWGVTAFVLGLVASHAAFILGGTLFRKHQFVLSCVLWWLVIPFVIGSIFTGIGYSLMAYCKENDCSIWVEWYVGEDFAKGVLIFMELAFITFCYWYSFRLFSRSQIINNRFFNR